MITDRPVFSGQLISNYGYRVVLPGELVSITETGVEMSAEKSIQIQIQILP